MALYAPVIVLLAAVCSGAQAATRGARVLHHEADELAKDELAKASVGTETATLASGLPDNDHFRRRLFFIGDLATDFVREPSRLLLPPPGDIADVDVNQGTSKLNYADDEDDLLSGEVLVHEKDNGGEERPGPGRRGHTGRDQEIRYAMEDGVDFQGPLLEYKAAKDGDRRREGRRQTFRWSVVDTTD